MAQVQDSEGIPSVAPASNSPDSYQRLDASPSSFGADIGRAAQGFGQQVAKAANDVGEHWGKIQVDDSLNSAFSKVSDIVHGTGATDPLTGQIDNGYLGTRGNNALEKREAVSKTIDDVFTQQRMKLKDPLRQREFDNAARTYRDRNIMPTISSHARREAEVAAQGTQDGTIKLAFRDIANNADDQQIVNHSIADATRAAVTKVRLRGGSEEEAAAAADDAIAGGIKTQAQAMAVNQPQKALALVERSRDALGIHYDELANRLRARATEQNALGVADWAFGDTAQAMQNPVQGNAAAVREAILQQESGNRDNVATSIDGAVGPGQVMPNTFAAYAKPGEDIKNPADNRVVAARIVDDLSKKYDGDPARIAVGYFSGPGNVAPAGSPTPWLRDVADGNGKTVSSYVNDVTQRMGTQGAMLGARASVYDKIMARTEGNPVLRQAALKEVDQRYRAAEIADLQDQKARKLRTDTALRGYGDMIRGGQAAAMPWRKDIALTEDQVEHLDKLAIDYAKEAVNGQPGDYGPKYSEVQSRIYSAGADRIVNQEQLDAMAARREINPAGHAQATKLLAEMNKAGAEGDRVIQSNFWNSARRAVTLDIGEQESDSTATPERRKKWDAAIPALNKALTEGREKGLTNQQLMDPTNKDSVWGALKPFLPTENEKVAAAVNVDAKATRAPKLAELDTYEKALDAYEKGQIKRDQFRDLFKKNKWRDKIGVSGSMPQVPGGGAAKASKDADVEHRKAGEDMGEWDQKFVDHLNAEPKGQRNLSYAMDYFAKNGENETQRTVASAVAAKLRKAGDDKFKFIPQSNAVDYGVTTEQDGKILVALNAKEGLNGEIAVHEGLHAIVRHFADGFRFAGPSTQRAEALADLSGGEREAATKLLGVFDRMKGARYEGKMSETGEAPGWFRELQAKPSEFLSYAMTSPDLQAWMRTQPDGASANRSMWDKFVEGVEHLVFGKDVTEKQRTMLEDALDAGNTFVKSLE